MAKLIQDDRDLALLPELKQGGECLFPAVQGQPPHSEVGAECCAKAFELDGCLHSDGLEVEPTSVLGLFDEHGRLADPTAAVDDAQKGTAGRAVEERIQSRFVVLTHLVWPPPGSGWVCSLFTSTYYVSTYYVAT